MSNPRVLMIVTSHDELGSSDTKTGFWLEELAAPYYELLAGGAAIDIASPKGGRPPADPKSTSSEAVVVKRFLDDREATAKLESTRRLEDVDAAAYDAFFIVGGHGVMWDLAASPALGAMLGRAFDAGKVVAAVCHGPAGLVNARDASGAPIVAGRRVAGFSNEEEDAVGLTGVVPFALETKLRDLGGCYERGPAWSSFAVRDGTLVTGQNPASSAAVARLVVEALGA
jgi:putative intracellular protease/amidase